MSGLVRALCTAGVQAGALTAAGDVLAQTTAGDRGEYDWRRTATFAGVGAVLVGPTLRIWYGILNKHIGSTGTAVTLKKVFVDQCFFAPPFIATFLGTLKVLEGKTLDEIKSDFRSSYPEILKTNYCLWPAVQLGNFYLVPLRYQVLTVQCVALLWNTYLSHKAHEK